MPTIGEQLRKARLERGISIEEIAAATHINRQYLENIEQDVELQLPTTYVRAFIRSFAAAVGLDPVELLRSQAPPPPPSTEGPPAVPPPPEEPEELPFPRQTAVPVKQHQIRSLAILTIAVLLCLTASIIYLQRDHQTAPVAEIEPEPVKNQGVTQADLPGDSAKQAAAVAPREALDSLLLEAVSVETVYVRVVADSVGVHEYTLAPQHRVSWKAMHSFRVSVGNSGGIFFTLNGKHLGTLGRGSGPLRDVLLTREALQNAPAKKPHEKTAGVN